MILSGCEPESVSAIQGVRSNKVAFLDRDGVINIDRGYVSKQKDFEWVDGVFDAVQILRSSGFRIVVVTNQSGIGRGLYSEADFLKLTEWMLTQIELDDVLYCPHAPEANCVGRKPRTGMFQTAERLFPLHKIESFLIGDKPSDLEAAFQFGIRGEFFEGGNLAEFVKKLLGL